MPKIKPAIKIAGKTSQLIKTMTPAKSIKISTKIPAIIKNVLKIAPIIRKIKLEKAASKYLPISNPRP